MAKKYKRPTRKKSQLQIQTEEGGAAVDVVESKAEAGVINVDGELTEPVCPFRRLFLVTVS